MESPAQIRRLRQLAVERIARHEHEIDIARREIALYDELLRLHESHSEGTLSPMQANSAQSLGVRIAAGRGEQSESRKEQVAANLTDAEVADLTGYNRSTVCKWHNGSMTVPEEARKLLAKRGIKSWKKR